MALLTSSIFIAQNNILNIVGVLDNVSTCIRLNRVPCTTGNFYYKAEKSTLFSTGRREDFAFRTTVSSFIDDDSYFYGRTQDIIYFVQNYIRIIDEEVLFIFLNAFSNGHSILRKMVRVIQRSVVNGFLEIEPNITDINIPDDNITNNNRCYIRIHIEKTENVGRHFKRNPQIRD